MRRMALRQRRASRSVTSCVMRCTTAMNYTLVHLPNSERIQRHVVLREHNVMKYLFSTKVPELSNPKLSAFYRWCVSEFQNNESVIEGMISSAAHQAFDNHVDDTLEQRLFIKLSSDNLASSKDVTKVIATVVVLLMVSLNGEFPKLHFQSHLDVIKKHSQSRYNQ